MTSPQQQWRYATLRAMTSLAGDIALATAVASACSWLIQSAALGLFLVFLVWLFGLILSLALSQYLVHPTVQWVMANDKLSRGFAAVSEFSAWASGLAAQANSPAARTWFDRFSAATYRRRSA